MLRPIVKSLFAWLLFCSVTIDVSGAEGIRSLRNEHFEVVGLHLRSVTYVNELSLVAVEVAERYLTPGQMAYPLPILVSLRPEEHTPFEGDYRIRVESRNAVQLDIRWESELALDVTCRALSEALLVQCALYEYGQDAATQLRSWSVDALASEVYLRLRPAAFMGMLNSLRDYGAADIQALTSERLQERATPQSSGYWLIEAMQSSGVDSREIRRLFQMALAGMDVAEPLHALLRPQDPTAAELSLGDWWWGQLATLLDRDYEIAETMAVSREWLEKLAQFDSRPATDGEEPTRLNLRSIRQYRQDAAVQEWVQARYEILLLRMSRVNPAYFNAARSLGVLFEAFLEDAPPHAYLHALTIYLSDWEDAKKMERMIEEKLSGK